MTSKRSTAIEELDPKEVEGFSDAQKAYYLGMGYRPYRMASGNVKWLSPTLHPHRINNVPRKHILKKMFTNQKKPKVFKRRHHNHFRKFFTANVVFILLFLILVIAIGILLKYPQIIIRG